jgi:hypothetical protein
MGLTWDQSNLAKMYHKKGEIEGRAEGKAETLVKLLTLKFTDVPERYKLELMELRETKLDTILENILTMEDINDLEGYLQ